MCIERHRYDNIMLIYKKMCFTVAYRYNVHPPLLQNNTYGVQDVNRIKVLII